MAHLLKRLFSAVATRQKPKNYDIKLWRQQAQEGELTFHKQDRKRQSRAFAENSKLLFEYFGLHHETFRGRTVIDLGAGSKLRTKYFTGAKLIAIEPLAKRFMEEIPWCDLNDADAVHAEPAEQLIQDCINSADLLISINVLDHCYDFDQIVANIRAYLKSDGLAFLSFDEHKYRDPMHPLILSDNICREVFSRNCLSVEKYSKGFGGHKHISKGKDTYGHGDFCLNYWLKPVSGESHPPVDPCLQHY